MAEVFLNDHGNGFTSCNALPPMVEGETFTIYFHPDAGAELVRVFATDSHDYPVALPSVVNNEITMQFRSAWGNLYVEIYYSGSVPPEPPTPTTSKLWLLMGLKKNNERGLKPYVRN